MVRHYLVVFGHLIDLISNFLADGWLLLLVDLLLLVLVLTLTFQEINESLLFILVHLLELLWADKELLRKSKFLLLLFDLNSLRGLCDLLLLLLILLMLMLIVTFSNGWFCSQFRYNRVVKGYLELAVRIFMTLGLMLLLLMVVVLTILLAWL